MSKGSISHADAEVSHGRSKNMSRIRGANTKPEIAVRKLLHSEGYRFRLHANDLPGKPDIVFRSRRKVIFVHGCFWHRHEGCRNTTVPKTRTEFWLRKFSRNIERDREVQSGLIRLGWQFMIIWECQIFQDDSKVISRIREFLKTDSD